MQVYERFEAMKPSQPNRTKMLGVVWGKNHVEVWRFGPEGSDGSLCVRSNLLPFAWEESSPGYQVIAPITIAVHAISVGLSVLHPWECIFE